MPDGQPQYGMGMVELLTRREVWREVPAWPGYEVSSHSRVRSLRRVVIRGNGVPLTVKPRIMRQSNTRSRYKLPSVTLADGGRRRSFFVHRLTADVFGPEIGGIQWAPR